MADGAWLSGLNKCHAWMLKKDVFRVWHGTMVYVTLFLEDI